jgi:hypothetical protein
MVPALEFPLNYPENRPSHRPGHGHHRVSADDQRYVIGYERSGVRGVPPIEKKIERRSALEDSDVVRFIDRIKVGKQSSGFCTPTV